MKIVFIGEKPEKSAPTLTWAKALSKIEVEYQYIDFSEISTRDWIKKVLKTDVIIYQCYEIVPQFDMRQLALATFLGCPIVRKWSGSDIYLTLTDSAIKKSTQYFDKLVTLNLTSEHIGIIDELMSIGLTAQLTDQIVNDLPQSISAKLNKAVLAYLPDNRYEFYGYSYIESLIQKYPETEFIIVADRKHALADYKNVTSLGWVDDMEPVWDKVGLLIRITEHDGFARSILEALARNKYVIHNRQYEGCWYADNLQSIEKHLEIFLRGNSINNSAKKIIENLSSDKPVKNLFDILSKLKTPVIKRIMSLYHAIILSKK